MTSSAPASPTSSWASRTEDRVRRAKSTTPSHLRPVASPSCRSSPTPSPTRPVSKPANSAPRTTGPRPTPSSSPTPSLTNHHPSSISRLNTPRSTSFPTSSNFLWHDMNDALSHMTVSATLFFEIGSPTPFSSWSVLVSLLLSLEWLPSLIIYVQYY